MTQFQKSTLRCSYCGHSFEIKYTRNIKSDNNTHLRSKILDYSLFKYPCPSCKEIYDVEYEFLYHDPDRKYIIWFQLPYVGKTPFQTLPPYKMFEIAPKDYKYRIVNTRLELAEKIKIFDASLDDKTVELVKLGILARDNNTDVKIENIYFDGLMSDIDPIDFDDDLSFRVELSDFPDDGTIISRSEYIAHMRIMAIEYSEFIQDSGEWEKADMNTIAEYSKMKAQGIKEIESKWKEIVQNIPRSHANAAALLNSVKKISKTGNILEISLRSELLVEKAERDFQEIEKAIRNGLGFNYIVKLVTIK